MPMPAPKTRTPDHPRASLPAGLALDGEALPQGPEREALHPLLQALDLALEREGADRMAGLCQAHTNLARGLAGLGAHDAAELHLSQAMHWSVVMMATDSQADLACARAEVAINAIETARSQGASESALQPMSDWACERAFEGARLAGHTSDPTWEVKLLLRASDVLERCGQHSDAIHLQFRAMALLGLHHPAPTDDALPMDSTTPDAMHLTAPGQLM